MSSASAMNLRNHGDLSKDLAERDGISLDRRQKTLAKLFTQLNMAVEDVGSTVEHQGHGLLHNQCFYLALGSVCSMDPMEMRNKIERNVARQHPEWLRGGLHQEALSDYLQWGLRGCNLDHLAICVFDGTLGTAEIYKGSRSTNVACLYFVPGHYKAVRQDRGRNILLQDLLNALQTWFVRYVVIDT